MSGNMGGMGSEEGIGRRLGGMAAMSGEEGRPLQPESHFSMFGNMAGIGREGARGSRRSGGAEENMAYMSREEGRHWEPLPARLPGKKMTNH